MTIGADAIAAGYPLVPDTGSDDAKVRWGAREINRTRDLVARLAARIPAIWPVDKGGTGGATKLDAKKNLGISYGTLLPTGGSEGDIYFRVI